jgi:predicted Fe-Mo cluster-binding NifX family protein
MKIAISTAVATLDSLVDPRFGRAISYIIVDSKTEEWKAYPNPALNASSGAGVQAAQFIARHGAQAVISGAFGPNAYDVLSAAGVQMFQVPSGAPFTASELLVRYRRGQLQKVPAPTNLGHHAASGDSR